MIPVTKPFLPEIENYYSIVKQIWGREILTNNGPLVREFESEFSKLLKTSETIYLSNGTIALQIAIKALNLTGNIITTPFSFVATTSSIVWEGCNPIFADIVEDSFNIDPDSIEKLIDKNTKAILATHCFGNPCEIEKIESIAKRNNLKIIYDGAHCFGTEYKGESVFSYGDICTTSFHATKIFHTIEGGAIFANSEEIRKKVKYLRNFGHDGPEKFNGVGVNGKNSEFHAAMGICLLKDISSIMERRKQQYEYYKENLHFVKSGFQKINDGSKYNYSYFPLVLESEELLLKVISNLNQNEIFPRRYFYPTLSKLNYIKSSFETPIADSISSRIVCLPLYHNLSNNDIEVICSIIRRSL